MKGKQTQAVLLIIFCMTKPNHFENNIHRHRRNNINMHDPISSFQEIKSLRCVETKCVKRKRLKIMQIVKHVFSCLIILLETVFRVVCLIVEVLILNPINEETLIKSTHIVSILPIYILEQLLVQVSMILLQLLPPA